MCSCLGGCRFGRRQLARKGPQCTSAKVATNIKTHCVCVCAQMRMHVCICETVCAHTKDCVNSSRVNYIHV